MNVHVALYAITHVFYVITSVLTEFQMITSKIISNQSIVYYILDHSYTKRTGGRRRKK